MDIRIILGRIGIYALSAGIVVLYVLFVSYWNDNLKLVSSSIYGSFVALTVIPLFYYISQSLEKLASKYFYYTIYSLKQTIERLLKELNQTIEMNKLIGLISSSLLDSLKLERIGIILKEPREKTFRVQSAITSKKEELLALIKTEDGFLFQYLQEKKEALVREEIPYIIKQEETKIRDVQQKEVFKQKKQKLEIIKKELDKLEMGLVLPLLIEKKLIGIIILGNKLSGEAYTIQDFNLLSILSAQSSIAINNALSYEEIEIRKAELEKFYKLTVGRELRMRELKERIRNLEGKLEKT